MVELAERRCVVFMGAGVSAGSEGQQGKHPPTWPVLLERATERVPSVEDRTTIEELLSKERFLDAAQVIHDALSAPDLELFLSEQFVSPNFAPCAMHEVVRDLDAKVVLTTNFDDIYDRLCVQDPANQTYTVCRYYDTHAVNALRSRNRLILKAHGCVTDPARIVLTRRQYADARRQHQGFFSVLDALVLTNTILFLGCGMVNDPAIQLLLENPRFSVPSSHPHYALIDNNWHPSIKEAIAETHNLNFVEFPASDYQAAVEALRALLEQVDASRAIPE